jgi:hypothetical protein
MAFSQTQIISNAVALLGKGIILSTDGQSTLVNTAVQAFNFLLPCKLSEHFWRFATTIVQLAQINVVPVVTNWTTVYQLPGDYLETVRVYPQYYDWEIYQGVNQIPVIYSNYLGPFYLEYVRQVDVTLLPAYFCHYFVYELAYYLALSNAQQTQFYQVLKADRDYQLGIALAKDAQNRPQTPLASQPIITNRFVATWISG